MIGQNLKHTHRKLCIDLKQILGASLKRTYDSVPLNIAEITKIDIVFDVEFIVHFIVITVSGVLGKVIIKRLYLHTLIIESLGLIN